ncbi:hypothetical protein E2562_004554 [Oryza meyeriana var. granulata]|uniref:Uncharacterized protein n=1 Tax=Oryza meyeriana var. granulata TaxID=110450 RepID=A0A6G1F3D9_9ORYZ|nr:hypothetical protein E2562_004554 [Oryza meyeriana var. granulata]
MPKTRSSSHRCRPRAQQRHAEQDKAEDDASRLGGVDFFARLDDRTSRGEQCDGGRKGIEGYLERMRERERARLLVRYVGDGSNLTGLDSIFYRCDTQTSDSAHHAECSKQIIRPATFQPS